MEYEALFNPRYVAGFIDDCPEADEIIKNTAGFKTKWFREDMVVFEIKWHQ